jgi:hypothetical protein
MEGGSTTHEEMLLNVIAACTNVTFFSCQVSIYLEVANLKTHAALC